MKYKDLNMLLFMAIALFETNAFAKDSDVEARGPLVALSSESVTVGSLTCQITSSTEYKDQNDQSILPSAFDIGDNVKLKCRGENAKELELKTSDDNNGGGNGGDDNKKNGGKTRPKETEIDDKASKSNGVSTLAGGRIEYRYKRDNKNKTEISFKSNLKIPVPSTIPLITGSSDAGNLNLSITISRKTVPYAVCNFIFDRVLPTKNSKTFAEYKIDLREKRSSLNNKKGSCDMDLTTDGIQNDIPKLKKGDTYIITDALAGEFLKGTI